MKTTSNEYRTNCQSCVPTFLARLQGYDVTAKPFDYGDVMMDIARHPNHAYIDPNTNEYPVYKPAQNISDVNDILNYIENLVLQDELYSFDFGYKINGTVRYHIVTLVRDKYSRLCMYDPQDGSWYRGDNLLQYISHIDCTKDIYLLRINNLMVNKEVADYLME